MHNKIELIEHPQPAFLLDRQERPELPVLITARFEVLSDRAALQLTGNNVPTLFLSVIHEGREGIEPQTIRGDQTGKVILVHDAESLLILARHEGTIVAGAMLQCDIDLVDTVDQLLYPVASAGIIVEQHNLRRSGVSLRAAMPSTAIPVSDETIRVPAVKIGGAM
jgi:hypothetical protein